MLILLKHLLVNGDSAEFPIYPDIPDDSVVLAAIYIPAGTDTTLPSGTILDKRVFITDTSIEDASTTESGLVEIATLDESKDNSITDKVLVPSVVHGLFNTNLTFISNSQPPLLEENKYFINLNSPLVLNIVNEEFTLDSGNGSATGITVSNYRFYVVDSVDNHIYIYDHQGNRQINEEFTLNSGNGAATGVAINEDKNRIYVGDFNANKIFVYNQITGDRVDGEEFGLVTANTDLKGMYADDDYIYVFRFC